MDPLSERDMLRLIEGVNVRLIVNTGGAEGIRRQWNNSYRLEGSRERHREIRQRWLRCAECNSCATSELVLLGAAPRHSSPYPRQQ